MPRVAMPSRAGLVLALLLLAAAALPLLGLPYFTRLGSTILVLSIAAISLNILVGYGGLVSFGHAAFFGAGAYSVGILGLYGQHSALLGLPLAALTSGLLALAIGAASLRVRGVFFIMITLAFSQMVFYLAMAAEKFGGDDGLRMAPEHLGPIDLGHPIAIYYVAFAGLLGSLVFCHRLMAGYFGRALIGLRDNEPRMRALGFHTNRIKLVAFVIAGGQAGIAGALDANLSAYASPEMFHWTLSGDLLIMLTLGGVGTLAGPVFGAMLFQTLQQAISAFSTHWLLYFGPALLAVVLLSNHGLIGLLNRRWNPRHG